MAVLVVLRVTVDLISTRVEIGPETTVIDGPLRPDGTIDYAAALNNEWAAGVTPDQNAAVDLLRGLGPGIIDEEARDAYFARLGIPVPPLEGEYLVDFRQFLETQGISQQNDLERFDELNEQHGTAMSRPWTRDEFPEVAAWLDGNRVPLEAILSASRRPRYFSPLIAPNDSGLINVVMQTEQNSREAARVLTAQAMLELGSGEIDRAFELTLACHRLARQISEHPTIIGSLISIALEAMVTQGDSAIVVDRRLTTEQAAEFRRRLQALPPTRTIAEICDRGERFMALDSTLSLFAGRAIDDQIPGAAVRMGFNPNPSLRRFNEFYDEAIDVLKLSDPNERSRGFAELDERVSRRLEQDAHWWLQFALHSRSAVSEWIGDVLVRLLWPVLEQAAVAQDRRTIRLALCDIGYALAEFRAGQGRFPEALDDLVPAFIEAVPLDPYTGAPYRYQLTDGGFLLHSVSQNGVDDGGVMDVRVNKDDIAFGDLPVDEVEQD
ncbi:MAG: hypothetical protein AB7U20_23630 [Planctomycetaceae bacterium]